MALKDKIRKLIQKIKKIWNFLTYDIWRISDNEVSKTRSSWYFIIKTIFITIRRFTEDRITTKASALTYSTILAIVPILAILFAIARGFGFANIMEQQFRNGFGAPSETTETILLFVDSYLAQAKSGIFIGIGLIVLLWTVINLINHIENTFNSIWEIKKARNIYRKITDYFAMFLLLPILIVISSGITIFMSTIMKHIEDYVLLAPIVKFLVRLIPYIITWFMFTGLYIYMPNTRVKFKHAFISGIIAGTAYQAFQFLYISGQLWVTRYNAIYGSFAALPLLILWLHVSWTICLFDAQLTYAGQNIHNFNFETDTKNISRRYRDFMCITIMSLIAKRFVNNEPAYTAEEISSEHQIPIRLTNQIMDQLQNINLIHEVYTDQKSSVISYQPSIDINQLNVALLLDRLDTYGSEDFKVDKENEFSGQWKALLKSREEYYKTASHILLKDL